MAGADGAAGRSSAGDPDEGMGRVADEDKLPMTQDLERRGEVDAPSPAITTILTWVPHEAPTVRRVPVLGGVSPLDSRNPWTRTFTQTRRHKASGRGSRSRQGRGPMSEAWLPGSGSETRCDRRYTSYGATWNSSWSAPRRQSRIARIHRSCRCLWRDTAGTHTPNHMPPRLLGLPGLSRPQPLPPPWQRWRLKAHINRTTETLPYFLVQVEVHMERCGGDYEDEVEQVHEVGAASWYVGLYKGRAPQLRSFPCFMLALRQQFEDPFEEEKARGGEGSARLQQIRQGSRSVSDYVSEFGQLAGVVQDWPEQVKIHFFREGLHPEVAQRAIVTTKLTSLVGWYTRVGEAEAGVPTWAINNPKGEQKEVEAGTSLIQQLMTVLISEHGQIFSPSSVDGSGAPADNPAPDWISKKENRTPGSACLPLEGAPSLLKALIPEPPSQGSCNQAPGSPGTREQILPTRKCSFCQPGTKSFGPKVDVPSLPSSGNWLWNGLCSLHSHRKAPSTEHTRDSSSFHRLSIYDNVPLSSQGSPSTSWKGSLAGESVNSWATCRSGDSSTQTEWAARGPLLSSVARLENSTERSDTFFSRTSEPKSLAAASRDSVACSGALQSLVVELKAELSKQRVDHEANIQRVEETSTELKKVVAKLEEELDQEKKKFRMLEIKFRNSERACEDANKRNQLLQKEMEDFFATLGNLTAQSPVD
uniref:Uncharacterized protein n=1 Tax=Sphaerodactylus townsendi TaxID=933632 RepID=A0ACB8F7F9_9SAUR